MLLLSSLLSVRATDIYIFKVSLLQWALANSNAEAGDFLVYRQSLSVLKAKKYLDCKAISKMIKEPLE